MEIVHFYNYWNAIQFFLYLINDLSQERFKSTYPVCFLVQISKPLITTV